LTQRTEQNSTKKRKSKQHHTQPKRQKEKKKWLNKLIAFKKVNMKVRPLLWLSSFSQQQHQPQARIKR
jgi:hypothetical protein